MPTANEDTTNNDSSTRRQVDADLIEATPDFAGLGMWILASPLIAFLAWLWTDLARLVDPTGQAWLNVVLGLVVFFVAIVLPLGYAAFYVVTALPRLFRHAGWDIQPREPVREAEMYTVHYVYRARHRARFSVPRFFMRAGQGWVFIEIATILLGAVLMIPLFFSATEFGFGR